MPVTRLLAIGDVHLGRQSRRLPSALDGTALGPAAALRLAVETALARDVRALLLAGDIVDGDGDLYHALGVLTDLLAPLRAQGVDVIAVAGNHDHAVLPRLVRAVPGVRVLGAGGSWETATVGGPGGPVRVLGWSFPAQHHPHSPAADLARLDEGPPALGLLHADLDAASGRYAPVTRGELEAAGPCRWLLGHVHTPSLDPATGEPGYLGSLVGLDPTEVGPRGPWLVEVDGRQVALRFLPQAPLRWDRLDVAVDDAASPRDELPALITEAMQAFVAERQEQLVSTSALGLRLRLTGRTADLRALCAAADAFMTEPPVLRLDEGLQGFVDRIDVDANPLHDLAALAERDDPPGLLARELLALRAGRAVDLQREARQALQQVDGGSSYRSLGAAGLAAAPDDDTLAAALMQSGYLILDELLRAKEVGDGTA